ncbi:hypothetical protein [Zophobihabitans entericus]|uniref:Uncharacterized protein n=1 Tax=Zophobihabitans entericus TaxID=1635327 RepID=A0A6G9IBB8_9GAMM|nr:hypothetical protein [Zophobihabitans entericus]QIQ21004.1 hypothetical protein IPMB12_04500 [Zophobihabitans entericus]
MCHSNGSSTLREGFAFPEGLRRHLLGEGKAHQCLFIKVAKDIAWSHWNKKFAESDRQEREEERQQLARRRQTEALYKTSPFEEVLIDNGWSFNAKRNKEQLTFAEERLSQIGFTKITGGNIQAWVQEHEKYIVYADWRISRSITFSVWKKPLPKKQPFNTYKYKLKEFYLLDEWKHDLVEKYKKRLPD